MGDEHLDTISTTESDEVIKSSVEDLVPIPSESEGIPEHKCDVPFHDNSPPLDVSKVQIEDFSESNNKVSSIDDDSFSIVNNDYLVSSEVMKIVIPEVGGIDDDIPLTIKDDNLREKLLNVNLLIATIEALNDNPTPSFDCKTKSSSTFLNSFLEETNTFHNFLPEFENFYFDLGEISSGSTTTHSDILFLNMIRLSLTLLMRSSSMNSLTSYLLRNMIVSTFGICPIRFCVETRLFCGDLLSSILENLKTLAKGFYPPSLNFLSFNWES
nr:hypothetical protein [Tanacetum cinerariifolium]